MGVLKKIKVESGNRLELELPNGETVVLGFQHGDGNAPLMMTVQLPNDVGHLVENWFTLDAEVAPTQPGKEHIRLSRHLRIDLW